MTILKAPAGTLADGVVELRLPSPDADDIATINQYVQDEQLDGAWLPDVPLVTGERLVKDWLHCWKGGPSRDRATFTFVVTVPGEPRFVGVVGVAERDDGAFEMSYGTAPGFVLAETLPRSDPAVGETAQLRYIMDRPATAKSP